MARAVWKRRSVVYPFPSPTIQLYAHPPSLTPPIRARERATDLVVASAVLQRPRPPRQRPTEASNGVARLVGWLYLSSCLSFMSLSSQVPFRSSALSSASARPLCQRAECGPLVLHLLFHLRTKAEHAGPGRGEERRGEIHCAPPLKNVHNSSLFLAAPLPPPSAASCSSFSPSGRPTALFCV